MVVLPNLRSTLLAQKMCGLSHNAMGTRDNVPTLESRALGDQLDIDITESLNANV